MKQTCNVLHGLYLANSCGFIELADSEERLHGAYLHCCSRDVGSSTSRDDWQFLSEVSCQNKALSQKWLLRPCDNP